jgi:hypothetical protein
MNSVSRRTLAIVAAALFIGSATCALAGARVRNDPRLLAVLVADRRLQFCGCVRAAAWLDESYPRITVDPPRWRALSSVERTRFGARVLHDVQTVYLEEWGTPHFYQQVFFVDPGGRQLFAYAP